MIRGKRKSVKQTEAIERQTAYEALSDEDKLNRALARGHEGTREVKRLRKAVQK